jgi:hypothetical protein
MARNAHISSQVASPKWLTSLDVYSDLVAIQFAAKEEFRQALHRLLNVHRGLPHDLVGSCTLIIPKEAVACFSGLKFSTRKVLSAADLPPEEIAQLRRENFLF